MQVFFSLGTNLGDRKANIEEALRLMDEAFGKHYGRISEVVESEAWGFEGPDFLDVAVMYDLSVPAAEVLRICKDIERRMGRDEEPGYDAQGRRIYHSRPIDIDILLYGDEVIDTPELKVPHPLIDKRPFIKGPLMQIMELND